MEGTGISAYPLLENISIPGRSIRFNFSSHEAQEIIAMSSMESYLSHTAEIIFVVCYVVVIMAGVIGNVLVGHVIWRKRTLRTPRNLYIINLTFSDLSMCVLCMPFTLIQLLNKNFNLGTCICKLIHVIQCTNILVSISTIVAIALDRYTAIVVGLSERSHYNVAWSLVIIWCISIVFTLPLLFWYNVHPIVFDKIVLYKRCMIHWPSEGVKYTYLIALILTMYVLPIIILGVVHASIKNYLSHHMIDQQDSRRAHREIERNRKTTMLLTALAIAFAVSWLPWQIVNILADFGFSGFQDPQIFYCLLGSCHLIAMSTACTNPILYGWLNTNLRRELIEYVPFLVKKFGIKRRWSVENTTKQEQEDSPTRGGESITYSTVVYKNSCSPRVITRACSPISPFQSSRHHLPPENRTTGQHIEGQKILLTVISKSPESQAIDSNKLNTESALCGWENMEDCTEPFIGDHNTSTDPLNSQMKTSKEWI